MASGVGWYGWASLGRNCGGGVLALNAKRGPWPPFLCPLRNPYTPNRILESIHMISLHVASPQIRSAARPIITTIVIELDITRAAGLITSPCRASLIAVTTGPTNGMPSMFPRTTPRHSLPRNVRPGPSSDGLGFLPLGSRLNIGVCVGWLANVAGDLIAQVCLVSNSQLRNLHTPLRSGAS